MNFAFNKQHPEWDTPQQLWILGQVSEGRTQRETYDDLIAEKSDNRPEDVARWTGSFNAFQKRLQRLTKNGIDPAINLETGQKFEFDLGTARGRYDYWIWLAQHTTDQKTRVQALTMIEKLAPQQEGNEDGLTWRELKQDARGKYVPDDFHTLSEVVALELQEQVANGNTEAVTSFLADVLCSLPQIRIDVIKKVIQTHPMSLRADETSDERVARLFNEIASLTEDEKRQLTTLIEQADGVFEGVDDDTD